MCTCAVFGDLEGHDGLFLELLLEPLDNFINCPYLEFPKLSLEVRFYDLVQVPQRLPQFRVEVIFYAVVSPALDFAYLPGKFVAMSAHLFPVWLCRSYRNLYSSLVHSDCMLGSMNSLYLSNR